jgi:hypothetical protein
VKIKLGLRAEIVQMLRSFGWGIRRVQKARNDSEEVRGDVWCDRNTCGLGMGVK